jgi:hypothetical protein
MDLINLHEDRAQLQFLINTVKKTQVSWKAKWFCSFDWLSACNEELLLKERERNQSKFQVRNAMNVIITYLEMWPEQHGVAFQVTAIVRLQYQKQSAKKCVLDSKRSGRKHKTKLHRHEVALLCGLLTLAVTYLHYAASNCRMNDEWWIGKDLKTVLRGLIKVLSFCFAEETGKYHGNPPAEQPVK